MKIAYCCKCVYRIDFCKIKMFPEMYVNFMKDIKTGFRIHLDMFVAKKNDIFISCCGHCLHKILIKTWVTPNYSDDNVCITFCKRYVKIAEFLEGIILLGNCTTSRLLQYYHNTRYSFCKSCMCNYILSLKNFLMSYFCRWILRNFVKNLKKIFGKYKSYCIQKRQRFFCGCKKMVSSPYATLLYEVVLYLDVLCQKLKNYFQMTVDIYFHCVNMFIAILERNLEKIVKKLD